MTQEKVIELKKVRCDIFAKLQWPHNQLQFWFFLFVRQFLIGRRLLTLALGLFNHNSIWRSNLETMVKVQAHSVDTSSHSSSNVLERHGLPLLHTSNIRDPLLSLSGPTLSPEEHSYMETVAENGWHIAAKLPTSFDLKDVFRIALVMSHLSLQTAVDRAVRAIAHPISQCQVTTLVILQPSSLVARNFEDKYHETAQQWLEQHGIVTPVSILHGIRGFQQLLDPKQAPHVEAVYLNTLDAAVESGTSTDHDNRNGQALQRRCSIEVLEAGLHLLLRDTFSTSLDEFRSQLQIAKRQHRFVQFYTLFDQEHRIQQFLNAILTRSRIFRSSVNHIDVTLSIHYDDVPKLGLPPLNPNWPLQPGQGCLRRIGRYCVLVGLIIMSKTDPDSRPASAKVVSYEVDDAMAVHSGHGSIASADGSTGSVSLASPRRSQRRMLSAPNRMDSIADSEDSDNCALNESPINAGDRSSFRHAQESHASSTSLFSSYCDSSTTPVPTTTSRGEAISAECVITFTNDQVLTFHVSYSVKAATRQVLQVHSPEKYATMTDFVIPHRDGLATYRIYERTITHSTGRYAITGGEACDVPSGPPQDAMMWRRFCRLARLVESRSSSSSSEQKSAPTTGKNTLVTSTSSEVDPSSPLVQPPNDLPAGIHSNDVREFTKICLYTKSILNALVESANQNYVDIPITECSEDDC
jgi:hypothetical protein